MTIYKFEADWCGPCKTQTRIMKGMDYVAIDIETDAGMALAKDSKVSSLPTIVIYNTDGEETARFIGVTPREAIQKVINAQQVND